VCLRWIGWVELSFMCSMKEAVLSISRIGYSDWAIETNSARLKEPAAEIGR